MKSINPLLQIWELGTHHLCIISVRMGVPQTCCCLPKAFPYSGSFPCSPYPSLPRGSWQHSSGQRLRDRKTGGPSLRALRFPPGIIRKAEVGSSETCHEFNWDACFSIAELWTSELWCFFLKSFVAIALQNKLPLAPSQQRPVGAGSRVRFGSILLLRSS